MSDKHWSQFLTHYCQNTYVLDECAQYDSFHQFWTESKRGDYMFLVATIWSKREPLVLAACACARLALPHVPAGENRPLICIETAEAWARGEVDLQQVEDAAIAAHFTAECVANTTAYFAAYSAVDASYASTAAYSAYCFTGVVQDQTLEQCVQIVRQMLPEPPFQRYYDLRAFL